MKIHINRESFTKDQCSSYAFLQVCSYLRAFTKEDRQKVRSFKLRMMEKYVYHSKPTDTDSAESLEHKNPEHKNADIIKKENKEETKAETPFKVIFPDHKNWKTFLVPKKNRNNRRIFR